MPTQTVNDTAASVSVISHVVEIGNDSGWGWASMYVFVNMYVFGKTDWLARNKNVLLSEEAAIHV